ncbi:MAG: hypothetical protein H6579_05065 [Chitinophagales bacterium]|nr:hypothetical protein [Chitinophagales bacterium]
MEIQNFDNNYQMKEGVSLFEEIFSGKQIGFVIRNFLEDSELQDIRNALNAYPKPRFEVFKGHNALPRPFDNTVFTDKEAYLEEVEYFEKDPLMQRIKDTFQRKLALLTNNSPLLFSSRENDLSFSKSWSSFRELHPGGDGVFELHCGNVFRLWNSEFFEHQYKTMGTTHLSCVVMVNRPAAKYDIEINKPHFDEYPEKLDHESLKNKNGERVLIKDIPCYNIVLNEGDLLLFDESNYWHIVSGFNGNVSRLTFGGFVSKFLGKDEYMIWA